MARNTGPGSDRSDRALDQRAFDEEPTNRQHWDPAEVAKHDDEGRDRLFEGREQHDEAEKNSEKTRLARDSQRHSHDVDSQEGDSGISHNAKRKS
jgi:hypothetical protein